MSQGNRIRYSRSTGVDVTEVHRNVSQEIIEITEDKLKLLLNEHAASVESRSGWQTPLALFVTIVLVLTTTSFKESLGVSADTWLAVFIISAVLCLFWFLRTLLNRPRENTVEDLLEKIKNRQVT